MICASNACSVSWYNLFCLGDMVASRIMLYNQTVPSTTVSPRQRHGSRLAGHLILGEEMTKEIVLVHGKAKALVDDEDYERMSQISWVYNGRYAVHWGWKNGKRHGMLMHRLIANTPPGMQTDHVNHDTLDNRRQNLRVCTPKQNGRNRRSTNPTGYKGVRHRCKRWSAEIRIDGNKTFLGTFDSPEEAARAYDRAALAHWGEFAHLNFAAAALSQIDALLKE